MSDQNGPVATFVGMMVLTLLVVVFGTLGVTSDASTELSMTDFGLVAGVAIGGVSAGLVLSG